MKPLDGKIYEEWLGPPVDIKGVHECKTLHESGGFAFELYKEACRVVAFVAHLLDDVASAQGGLLKEPSDLCWLDGQDI